MKNIKNLVIIFCILAVSAICLVKPAAAATRLSGISVQSACDHQYGPATPGTKLIADLGGKTVINWLCVTEGPGYYGSTLIYSKSGVDLSRECRRIYGSSAYAAYTSYYNPYSWGCYR
jgi:hypothetical protein